MRSTDGGLTGLGEDSRLARWHVLYDSCLVTIARKRDGGHNIVGDVSTDGEARLLQALVLNALTVVESDGLEPTGFNGNDTVRG